jgi:hypothetical protein
MRKMGLIKEKVKFLRLMDEYIRNITLDDEDGNFNLWLSEGIPDEADEECLREIAEDDSLWISICGLFDRIVNELEGL